jgi:branched-chain amino acid transport system ATP-binding protein
MDAILQIEGLNKSFGGLKAIVDVSLSVQRGQFLGIIGANGAGKTTLLNLITGYYVPTSGSIRFEGKAIDGLPPYRIARLGVGRTFQVVQPFAEMSVLDNVMTGALFSSHGDKRSLSEARRVCEGPLGMVGLDDRPHLMAGSLTLGGKKKLELARALATEPRLLLLDEVMGGLTRDEIEDLIVVLRRIREAGTTIVMIEHLVPVIVELCDYVHVLNFGRELTRGLPDDVIDNPEVIEAYLGRPMEAGESK